jgi:hypothetical protein
MITKQQFLISLNEDKLFNTLKQAIPDLQKSKWIYDRKDATSARNEAVYELKCRKSHYPSMLIEKDKYDSLIVYKNPHYINSTPEGIYSWDLTSTKPTEWKNEFFPCNTTFNLNDEICQKTVGYLAVTAATNITSYLLSSND